MSLINKKLIERNKFSNCKTLKDLVDNYADNNFNVIVSLKRKFEYDGILINNYDDFDLEEFSKIYCIYDNTSSLLKKQIEKYPDQRSPIFIFMNRTGYIDSFFNMVHLYDTFTILKCNIYSLSLFNDVTNK